MKIVASVERAFQLKRYTSVRFFLSIEGSVEEESQIGEASSRLYDQAMMALHFAFFKYKRELESLKGATDPTSAWERIKIRELIKDPSGNGSHPLLQKIKAF